MLLLRRTGEETDVVSNASRRLVRVYVDVPGRLDRRIGDRHRMHGGIARTEQARHAAIHVGLGHRHGVRQPRGVDGAGGFAASCRAESRVPRAALRRPSRASSSDAGRWWRSSPATDPRFPRESPRRQPRSSLPRKEPRCARASGRFRSLCKSDLTWPLETQSPLEAARGRRPTILQRGQGTSPLGPTSYCEAMKFPRTRLVAFSTAIAAPRRVSASTR